MVACGVDPPAPYLGQCARYFTIVYWVYREEEEGGGRKEEENGEEEDKETAVTVVRIMPERNGL